ncbi:ADAMTS-like protein 5 isoform X2 [Neoarius graeffei]|uniref:ADAMTS-like protein 5 isoform X2 n=1 Tax=Neoarius graeffei TaxID=443677 RepID=UPI00298D0B15|nr:ADAMTS-like protein 5 isoform X2 [Neoarius graeffei]
MPKQHCRKLSLFQALTLVMLLMSPDCLSSQQTQGSRVGRSSRVPRQLFYKNEWASWGVWSECSRSCGGGASIRRRTCIYRNPVGGPCLGDPRQYKICNTKGCLPGSLDFRELQCKAFDDKPLVAGSSYQWTTFHGGSDPCELSCLALGHNFYYNFGRVLDGTPCPAEPGAICVNGKCLKPGCDLIFGSQQQEDVCMVCGGQNTTCLHHHSVYRSNGLDIGPFGYNEVTMIPAGATHIRVTDNSKNYLGSVGGRRPPVRPPFQQQPLPRLERDEKSNYLPRTHSTVYCGKCRRVKGRRERQRQYCQKDYVFRAKILTKVYIGKETRYDVQIIHTYRNRFHLARREYLWAPNRCDCPALEEGYQYVLMVRRHVNHEQTLDRILLEEDSYAQIYRPREDSLLRPLEDLCSNRGPRTYQRG